MPAAQLLAAAAAGLLGAPADALPANCAALDAWAAGGEGAAQFSPLPEGHSSSNATLRPSFRPTDLPAGVLVCARRLPTPEAAPPPSPPPLPPLLAAAPTDLQPGAAEPAPGVAAEAAASAEAEPAQPDVAAQACSPDAAAGHSETAPPATGEAEPLAAPPPAEAGPAAAEQQELPPPPPLPAQDGWQLHACEPHAIPDELLGCPAVCFFRPNGTSAGPLPREEMEAVAAAAMLLPEGPSLSSLHHLLQHVVAPLLAAQQEQQQGQPSAWQPAGGAAASTAELLAATHRFAAQVAAAAKHCSREAAVVRLPVLPPGLDLADTAVAAGSEEAVLACERCMEEWVQAVVALLQREGAAQPEGPRPLDELAHWQARAEAYGGLLEQLSVPAVRAAQAVVERGSMDANLAAGFRAQLAELTRLVRGRARQGLCCVLRSRFIRWPARKWPLSFRCKLA